MSPISLFVQSFLTAYDLAERAENLRDHLDPQYSILGRMTYFICLNNAGKLKTLLQKHDFSWKINDPFPFSISLHRQFLKTPEAHRNGPHLWPQVTTLLRCAAFLNRQECLKLLKGKKANMVSLSFSSHVLCDPFVISLHRQTKMPISLPTRGAAPPQS
jgi:hypothetical protein